MDVGNGDSRSAHELCQTYIDYASAFLQANFKWSPPLHISAVPEATWQWWWSIWGSPWTLLPKALTNLHKHDHVVLWQLCSSGSITCRFEEQGLEKAQICKALLAICAVQVFTTSQAFDKWHGFVSTRVSFMSLRVSVLWLFVVLDAYWWWSKTQRLVSRCYKACGQHQTRSGSKDKRIKIWSSGEAKVLDDWHLPLHWRRDFPFSADFFGHVLFFAAAGN